MTHLAANVEPITLLTPRPVARPLLTQSWRDVTFLHWPIAPVAPHLPAGVRPDVFLLHLDDGLVAAAALRAPDGAPASVLYSEGLPVTFGRPSRVG